MTPQCHFSTVLRPALRGGSGLSIALALLWIFCGCSDAGAPVAEDYLLRAGGRTVSVQEFELTLEIAKAAYPLTLEDEPALLEKIRQQLLLELIEEMLVFQRAEELGLNVSEKELEARVEEIRADYPDGAFEQIFIQQAVSFDLWKKRTRDRLILEKVIAADLLPRSAPQGPPADRAEGVDTPGEGKDGVDGKPSLGSIPNGISNDRYKEWIQDLARRFPVDVDAALWADLNGSDSPQGASQVNVPGDRSTSGEQ